MPKIIFEFEDLRWFPDIIRIGMTDYLRYFLSVTNFYEPVTPLIQEALLNTRTNTIVDLCSGSGGSISKIYENLQRCGDKAPSIILTDKFPNIAAYQYLEQHMQGAVSYRCESVDAALLPVSLKGFRTVFSGIHHFDEQKIQHILQNAVDSNDGIGFFDGGDKNIFTILGIILFHPVAFLLLTPFFRPFRWSRLVFTYLLPLIPLCTVWDGVISILRLYQPSQLLTIARKTSGNYHWKAGKVKNRLGMHVTYLTGYPANSKPQHPAYTA